MGDRGLSTNVHKIGLVLHFRKPQNWSKPIGDNVLKDLRRFQEVFSPETLSLIGT